MGTYRNPTKTPVTSADMFEALGRGYLATERTAPSRESIAIVLSQWAMETGRGAHMMNFNVGGIKCPVTTGQYDWTSYTTTEGYGPTLVYLHPPNKGCQFRAYANLEEACDDYLALLQKRFGRAWADVVKGDPAAFVHDERLQGYFTASEKVYSDSIQTLFHEFMSLPESLWEKQVRLDPDTGPDGDPPPQAA